MGTAILNVSLPIFTLETFFFNYLFFFLTDGEMEFSFSVLDCTTNLPPYDILRPTCRHNHHLFLCGVTPKRTIVRLSSRHTIRIIERDR